MTGLRRDLLLDGQDNVRSLLPEPLEIEVLDVQPKRHFPWLLVVVVDLAKLLRVHAELASHPDPGV